MVAKPFCQSVWRRSADVQLVIASNNLPEARELVHRSGKEGVTEVVSVDVMDDAKVRALVRSADVVARCVTARLCLSTFAMKDLITDFS
jgi:saccharopine dehydrogenase-like NADP-dependent oxidoreductase